MSNRLLLPTVCALVLLAAAGAQGDAQSPSPAPSLPASALGAGLFRAPIHTQAPDEAFGAYGTWASGDTYKASFHDGFAFYPVLGERYPHNLPWHWRTTAVTVGGTSITSGEAPRHAHTDWRYEYDHGGVVEAYDVLPHGVEQTFVIARRPAAGGELVVTGRIESELRAAATAAAHQALTFAGPDGEAIVRYGHAFAFDAAGHRCDVATSFDGTHVRLHVPGDWLATAAFPVTVDPLTSSVALVFSGSVENPAIHRHDEPFAFNTMFVYSRIVSAGDRDVHATLTPDTLPGGGQPVFSDVAATWSSLLPDVTFVGGADRWVIGLWRHDANEDRVRAYFHDRDSTAHMSGAIATNHNPGTEHATFLALGGRSHPTDGSDALMVYRSDAFFGNSNATETWGVRLDAVNRTFVGRNKLSLGIADAESPDVNCQIGWGEDGWLVVFQGRDNVVDDFDLFVTRVAQSTFSCPPPGQVGPDGLGNKVSPVVQGWDGRYVVAALQDPTAEINGQFFARNVLTVRIDWAFFGAPTVVHPHQTIASVAGQSLTHLALGFDGVSRSHWCVTYDDVSGPGTAVRRIGSQGAVVEAAQLGTNAYHGAVTWNGVAREFVIANGSTTAQPLVARKLQYSPQAWHLAYGSGCGPGTITSDTVPLPGSEFYRVLLANAPPGQVGALCFSTTVGSADLGAIGAPNCTINLGSVDAMLPVVTNGTGDAVVNVSLPNLPLFTGDLYWQYLYLWPAAPTPLRIGVTNGLRASVR